MGRTAAPVTPGTNPAPSTDADELAQDALQAGALAAAATSEAEEQKEGNAELHAELAKRDRELAELRSMVQALGRNQVAQAMPEKVKLPELDAVMKQKPDIPVLTAAGWYVPPVHPTDKKAA